jgi:hypothetical protein
VKTGKAIVHGSIILFFYYGGVKDIISPDIFVEKGDSLQLRQYDEGTSMVTYNSKNSFILIRCKGIQCISRRRWFDRCNRISQKT